RHVNYIEKVESVTIMLDMNYMDSKIMVDTVEIIETNCAFVLVVIKIMVPKVVVMVKRMVLVFCGICDSKPNSACIWKYEDDDKIG
ncbi:578_t:CDS:1, partial [Racocetra persica]